MRSPCLRSGKKLLFLEGAVSTQIIRNSSAGETSLHHLFIYPTIYLYHYGPWFFFFFTLGCNLILSNFAAQIVPALAPGRSFSWSASFTSPIDVGLFSFF